MAKDCILSFKLLDRFSPGMVGMGMIAPPQVAHGLLLGTIFSYFLPRLVKSNSWSDVSNYDQPSAQSAWFIAPGLGALFGDAIPQILVHVLAGYNSKNDATGGSGQPPAQIDAHRPASVDESSRLLPGDEAVLDDCLEHQATAEPLGPTDDTWSLTSISIVVLLILLALHWLLIDTPANGLMPAGASFLSMLMGLANGFLSVWLMGRTSSNPVSAFGIALLIDVTTWSFNRAI
jgi:hypothetical protein